MDKQKIIESKNSNNLNLSKQKLSNKAKDRATKWTLLVAACFSNFCVVDDFFVFVVSWNTSNSTSGIF